MSHTPVPVPQRTMFEPEEVAAAEGFSARSITATNPLIALMKRLGIPQATTFGGNIPFPTDVVDPFSADPAVLDFLKFGQQSQSVKEQRMIAELGGRVGGRGGGVGDPETLEGVEPGFGTLISKATREAQAAAVEGITDPGDVGAAAPLDLVGLNTRARTGQLSPEDTVAIFARIRELSAEIDNLGIDASSLAQQAEINELKGIIDFNDAQRKIIGQDQGPGSKFATGLEQLNALNAQITTGAGILPTDKPTVLDPNNPAHASIIASAGLAGQNRAKEASEREQFGGFTMREFNNLSPGVQQQIFQSQQQQEQRSALAPLISQLLPGLDPAMLDNIPIDLLLVLITQAGQQEQLRPFGPLQFGSTGR